MGPKKARMNLTYIANMSRTMLPEVVVKGRCFRKKDLVATYNEQEDPSQTRGASMML